MHVNNYNFMRCKMFGIYCAWIPCRLAKKRKKGKYGDFNFLDFKESKKYRKFLKRRFQRNGILPFIIPTFKLYDTLPSNKQKK